VPLISTTGLNFRRIPTCRLISVPRPALHVHPTLSPHLITQNCGFRWETLQVAADVQPMNPGWFFFFAGVVVYVRTDRYCLWAAIALPTARTVASGIKFGTTIARAMAGTAPMSLRRYLYLR